MSLTRIAPEDFVFSNDSIPTSCWRDENGNPAGSISTTPSWDQQTFTNGVTNFYIGNPGNIQFGLTTANKNAADGTITRQMYGAIRNIVVGDTNADIRWNNTAQSQFNVIAVSKNIPLPLLPGSLRIGARTDDSKINPPTILNCGRAYNLVTGITISGGGFSFGSGTSPSGLFLPDVGLIIGTSLSVNTFILNTLNPTPTNRVFIRARNNQYNYSMNPSFISGSSGKIINQDWYDNPQTYITTVGLYNDNNELMATAKLPRPYNKNFNNELLMQVGLNF